MKIKTIIADDESLAREKITNLLAEDPDIEVVGEFSDGIATLSAIQNRQPDLVFLDVQMPELDGFGVLEALGDSSLPTFIFVTAYDQYALRAFEVHALDYLLKPFDRERFQKALQRAKAHLRKENSGEVNEKLLTLLEDLKSDKSNNHEIKFVKRLVIKAGGRVTFLKTEEIDWIEAAGNYVRLYIGKESHLLRETMNKIEVKLNPDRFLRVHRSTIVKMDYIKELQQGFHGEYVLTLKDGKQVTSSRSYRNKLGKLLQNSF